MKLIRILLFTLSTLPVWAQPVEGVVTYERVQYWTKINARLPFLSQEEKDRMKMTWGSSDGYKEKTVLYFNENQSKYTKNTEATGGYSWSKEEDIFYRDFANGTQKSLLAMLGKTYLLDDSLPEPHWKIMNQIKDISGHVCMLAVMDDTVRKQTIKAWFADDIPVMAGPEKFFGLPGLILEVDVNDGDAIITAIKVEMKPVTEEIKLPKKLKGKKLTNAQYESLISNHIQVSQKAYRNPYWDMRYWY
ncbi:GLPGLI family protein [Rhabdobacter roseus]|uniref:GLPGLI family protein n=1 Tax=Rhabdobacter roseus TaxID=1655419 RepID=A0A840TTP5_9BACT|nr:GLPGLI family protein [Rhabdobacter roseus]MBB5283059.1 GLPGLI family protein [Rhabdobacter roseus]